MHWIFLISLLAALLLGTLIAAASSTDLAAGVQAERVYLLGQVPSSAVEWDFYCTSGRRSGEWTTIPGVTWDYPAFKRVLGHVDWMSLDLSTGQTLQIDPQTLADVFSLRGSF